MNNRFGEKRNGIEFVHSFFCIKGKCWWLRLGARLHGHAIFGVVSVSDTCWTPVRVRLAWFQCPASLFFFFCFSDTALTRLQHASSEKKKKKSRMSDLSPLPAATAAALCRLPELDWADRRAAPLSFFFFFCFFFFFFFFVLSPRCLHLILLLLLLLRFLFLFRSF